MEWQEPKRNEVLKSIYLYYCNKVKDNPERTLELVEQELESQRIRLGNDWTGRGVVMDTVISATIEALEIVRAECQMEIKNMGKNTSNVKNPSPKFKNFIP